MFLHQLENAEGARSSKKRVGRGPGSGLGKTSGKGGKGSTARSGYKSKRGFEGGQTPLQRRLPKFGFNNKAFRKEYSIVNVSMLEAFDGITSNEVITKEILKQQGLISNSNLPVKLLGDGELKKSLKIEVDRSSASAIEKVKAAGGEVTVLEQ
ncbi:MAG: 50S ribosomal protein L15 [SAR324 cluster bacterium]|nr:50S ribosomal protein L15 [SAR324 cluster bacterium]